MKRIVDNHMHNPLSFKCKGLLVKRRDQMTLFTMSVNVAGVHDASLQICYQDLHLRDSANFTLGHLCSGTNKLVQ